MIDAEAVAVKVTVLWGSQNATPIEPPEVMPGEDAEAMP